MCTSTGIPGQWPRCGACLLTLLLIAAGGCSHLRPGATHGYPPQTVYFVSTQSIENVGACQGASFDGTFVYLYGDADPAVIRQYRFRATPTPRLEPTGVAVALTCRGKEVIAHPTGLALHPHLGAFLGNTVAGRGTIYALDWPQALAAGNLDRAILNVCTDDLAGQGTRPMFVRWHSRWMIATADYGDDANAVRLYAPQPLLSARRTSDPGVCVARFPCRPWVQNLAWVDKAHTLVIVRNCTEGLGWALDYIHDWQPQDFRSAPDDQVFPQADELEGWVALPGGWCLGCSSSTHNNIWLGRMNAPPGEYRV
ncbi:MAG TPA: hypothetical protein P5572_12155, partial [Phycisphaerae bacterium]|nr:hypothetical protein [Phycisphaerae bacterium]